MNNSLHSPVITLTHEGRTVYVQVSPCSWMYPRIGLQVGISVTEKPSNAETVFVQDQTIPAYGKSAESLAPLAEQMAKGWLAANGVKHLDDLAAQYAKDYADYQKKAKIREAARRKADIKKYTGYLAKGYTHVLLGWIHPESGGDDRMVEYIYPQAPTARQISTALRGSCIKTDYRVRTLAEAIEEASKS